MLYGVGVSCRILSSIFSYVYVSCSGSINSVGEVCYRLLELCGFCSERFPLPVGAWDGLRYFSVALPKPSILVIFFSNAIRCIN